MKINNFSDGPQFVGPCSVVTKLPLLVIWLPFHRMNTHPIAVRARPPDEVKDTGPTEIAAGPYMTLQSNDVIGRIQIDAYRSSQPSNGAAKQAVSACRCGVASGLDSHRWDYAGDAR